jgi:hypothetical protein
MFFLVMIWCQPTGFRQQDMSSPTIILTMPFTAAHPAPLDSSATVADSMPRSIHCRFHLRSTADDGHLAGETCLGHDLRDPREVVVIGREGWHGPYPASSPGAAPLIIARFTKAQCQPCALSTDPGRVIGGYVETQNSELTANQLSGKLGADKS